MTIQKKAQRRKRIKSGAEIIKEATQDQEKAQKRRRRSRHEIIITIVRNILEEWGDTPKSELWKEAKRRVKKYNFSLRIDYLMNEITCDGTCIGTCEELVFLIKTKGI